MPGRGWDVHRVPRVDSFDCRLLLEIKVVLGDFGFFLVVDHNRRLSRFFLGHFIRCFPLQDLSWKKISSLYQVYLLLRATRGDVTEMHGHARIWFVLSVMLLSSRGNHFLIQITCKIRPCEAWLCKLSYIEWESLLDMRIGNRTHTCRTSGRLLGPVSSTVSANT